MLAMVGRTKVASEKPRLLENLRNVLFEVELSAGKTLDAAVLVGHIAEVAKYARWLSQGSSVSEWSRMREQLELVFLSRLKPRTSGLKDFRDSLFSAVKRSEIENLPEKELQRLWDKRNRFFINEKDNVEDLRQVIVNRDKHKCRYCGTKEGKEKLHLHHVIPKEKYGGANTTYNLVATCSSCNHRIGECIELPNDWNPGSEVDANTSI